MSSARTKRRPLTRQELLARMPRAFRPPLDASQRLDLSVLHHQQLDDIANGTANFETLRQWSASILTWWKTAQLLDLATDDMQAQYDLAVAVIERYGRTGRVLFTGPDYQLAKHGVALMEALAATTDQPTAAQAADWCEAQLVALNLQPINPQPHKAAA